ncbi:MAG TPA: nitroreductase family protein [Candidatus Cloacimonadota bacterium]|nr:nitroreductase family protein [Candidatus Cloacimonadota bacterium]
MPNIIVNTELCNRCNTCASICLMHIIKPAQEESYPSIDSRNENNCLLCGHCEAFCPQQALVLDYLTEEKQLYQEEESIIAPHHLALYMQKRRSIRYFKPESVAKETITGILEIARYAPTGGNSQTVQWLVIHDPKEVRRISGLTVEWMRSIKDTPHPLANYVPNIIKDWENGLDPICRNAPHLVFAHIPTGDFIDDRTDAIIAITHFDIAAPAFGVGACWAGFIQMAIDSYEPLMAALDLPPKRSVGFGLFFGYPELETKAIPRRNPLEVVWRT